MPDALTIPFVVSQAFPAPMITECLSQLFGKSRGKWARGTISLTTLTDPCHV